jgi:hypothetical protein
VAQLLELQVAGGESVLVEVDGGAPGALTRGGRREQIVTAGETLEQVLGRIGPAARAIVVELREAADWPDEVEVEFAIKLSTDANVIIARSGAEANFRIQLRWSRERT